jgi:hypothetical protein
VLRPCLAVRRRRCRSPRAGVGELLKAVPEGSFIGPSGHRCPLHISGCITSRCSRPRSPVYVYGRLYIYIGPHSLYANTQRGSPPPREERRRGSAPRLGCRASTGITEKLMNSLKFTNCLAFLSKKTVYLLMGVRVYDLHAYSMHTYGVCAYSVRCMQITY